MEKLKSSLMMGSAVGRSPLVGVVIVYNVKRVLMVQTPLQLSETCIAAQDSPVDNGMDEKVHRCTIGEVGQVMEHTIRDHRLAFRSCFEFFDSICHYFKVIDIF